MNKEFIPYEEALELKQLGFQERCFGHYWENLFYFRTTFHHPSTMPNSPESCLTPTYSQAFRWFREKYNLKSCIMYRTNMEDNKEYYDWLIKGQDVVYRHFHTYEEAEFACLKKLIEIVKGGEK
jgi:hypothetical protein